MEKARQPWHDSEYHPQRRCVVKTVLVPARHFFTRIRGNCTPAGLWTSGPCFRHFQFDDCRQGINTFEIFLVKVGLHQFDAKVPLNLENQLKNVDGVDFEVSADERLIVAKIRRS